MLHPAWACRGYAYAFLFPCTSFTLFAFLIPCVQYICLSRSLFFGIYHFLTHLCLLHRIVFPSDPVQFWFALWLLLHLSVYSPYSPYSFSDYDLHYLLLRGSSTLRSFAAQTRLIILEALIGHPSISFVYMSTKLSLHCRFGHLFRCRSISFYDSYTSQLDLFFLRSHTLRMSLFI